MKREGLQILMAVMGLIPLITGAACFVLGPARMPGGQPVTPSIDGEYRFLSVYWLACGLVIYWMIPNIERHTRLFRFVAGIIFISGLGRLLSILLFGKPHPAYLIAMSIELFIVPLLVPWQASISES